jgi:hypothetical protein
MREKTENENKNREKIIDKKDEMIFEEEIEIKFPVCIMCKKEVDKDR